MQKMWEGGGVKSNFKKIRKTLKKKRKERNFQKDKILQGKQIDTMI